ncbi:MAG: PPC domain-containing protein, partial [Acidimicrobiaceae bacterium]|nr:PPC domain-containing protein [Acidimicrobiaceae bacterium]
MEVLIMHRFLFVKRLRVLVMSGAVVALIAMTLTLAGSNPALGQDAADCEVTDLGTLGSEAGSVLEAQGHWTTEDCDSRFRPGSDAHTYRFHVDEPGRIRIGLTSAVADSYLYLLAEDGSRITDNDDNGDRLDARVERDLVPGTYLVEATTVAGRARGPADFTLTVSRVEGCDFVHLG